MLLNLLLRRDINFFREFYLLLFYGAIFSSPIKPKTKIKSIVIRTDTYKGPTSVIVWNNFSLRKIF